ncbi:class E sortase, partial [Streptomyces sp. SID5926]|nr:class E sortase [Streptomyces sp. SID5926]
MTALRPERDSGTAGDQGSSYGQPYGDSGAFGGGRYEEYAVGEEDRPPLRDDETVALRIPDPPAPRAAAGTGSGGGGPVGGGRAA